jgi:sn-glycerol 3-phosphate transport system permease protein
MAIARNRWLPHLVLLIGVVVFVFPIYVAFVGSSHDAPTIARGEMPLTLGPDLVENYQRALTNPVGERVRATPALTMMRNSLYMALAIAIGKIAISVLSAFAVVFFEFPGRMFFFWMIFITLMLPVEVRMIPTYAVIANLGMIDTFAGLTIPLIASATATLLFRQHFLTVPDELVDASQIDGAGPMRFFWSVLLPLSRNSMAALFVIQFIYGWNQYLWPLIVTTSRGRETIVIGIVRMIGSGESQTDWQLIMAVAMLALIPPVAVIVLMERWFVKGLVDAEK